MLENAENKDSLKFDDKAKANILQKQFASVFTQEKGGDIPELDKRTNMQISNLVITEDMLRSEILSLNINKSCGPDEVHPLLLIELVDSISKPITLLMNKILQYGLPYLQKGCKK